MFRKTFLVDYDLARSPVLRFMAYRVGDFQNIEDTSRHDFIGEVPVTVSWLRRWKDQKMEIDIKSAQKLGGKLHVRWEERVPLTFGSVGADEAAAVESSPGPEERGADANAGYLDPTVGAENESGSAAAVPLPVAVLDSVEVEVAKQMRSVLAQEPVAGGIAVPASPALAEDATGDAVKLKAETTVEKASATRASVVVPPRFHNVCPCARRSP